jgi:uncharacterized membrane protein
MRPKGNLALRLPLLILHIFGGSISLIAGTVAMIARKGERVHRLSGDVFTAAMLTLATSGFLLALLKSQISNVIAAVLTFYLIASAWVAGRRREGTGPIDWAGFVICLVAAAGVLTLGVRGIMSGRGTDNGAPAAMSFIFGGILLIAAAGDARMLVRGGIFGRPRIVRHLWRMCVGLFIATGSFFLGQPQVFPPALRGSIYLIIPALLPVPLMFFWLVRVRTKGAYRLQPQTALVPSAGLKKIALESRETSG